MNPGANNHKIQGIAGRALFALFLLFLWLPTLDSFLKFDRSPETNENRDLARFPAWQNGRAGIQKYLTGLESYFNDHFGCRKRLVRSHTHWRNRWFHEASHPDGVRGTDDWLYYTGDKVVASYHLGEVFPPEQLRAWQKLFETRRDWLARRGIKYLLIIGPDKHSIYPEHLPAWLAKSPKPSLIEQFLEQMARHSTVDVLDFRGVLIAGKTNMPTYYSTDSHWTPYGAFLAYTEVTKKISPWLPGLKPLKLSDFEIKFTARHSGMDLACLLGIENEVSEKNFLELIPKPPLAVPVATAIPIATPADPRLRLWHREFSSGTGKVMVYSDSFGERLTRFFSLTFRETDFIFKHFWLPSVMEERKPDLVIDEFVERGISSGNPGLLLKQDNLK